MNRFISNLLRAEWKFRKVKCPNKSPNNRTWTQKRVNLIPLSAYLYTIILIKWKKDCQWSERSLRCGRFIKLRFFYYSNSKLTFMKHVRWGILTIEMGSEHRGGMPLRCAVFPDTHNLCCYKRAVKASEQPLFLYSLHSDDVLVPAVVRSCTQKRS